MSARIDDADLLERPARPSTRRGQHGRSRRAGGHRRRPLVLLAALVVGGVVAGLFGFHGITPAAAESTSVLAAEQALNTSEDGAEVKPMASITVAEAQARLQEVSASRAARAEAEAAAREAARPKAVLPVNGARLTTCFCMRWGTMHWGIDLAAPMLTPEYAAMDGVVLKAGAASGFGQAVYILHENGDVTVYGHMEKILVSVGDYVDAGQQIALLGMRGQSTGPHLHFEVHQGGINGKKIDPIPWLHERGVDI
jgi:murein DD-endopeptidase MepM/ murein hydrolase activator NlpD